MARLKRHTQLPVVVGFGIKTAEQAEAIAKASDGAVVGSALVSCIAQHVKADGGASAPTWTARRHSPSSSGFGRPRTSCIIDGVGAAPLIHRKG